MTQIIKMLASILVCLLLISYSDERINLVESNSDYFLLDNVVPVGSIKTVEFNKYEVDFIHVSNLVNNLKQKGYELVTNSYEERYIDYGFDNGEAQVRVIFDKKENTVLILSNPWEAIPTYVTYMSE